VRDSNYFLKRKDTNQTASNSRASQFRTIIYSRDIITSS
jgi:hypothetical protein